MRLILGTVQFGLDYGINNLGGKPNREKVFEILNRAYELGIRDLDTADFYGDAPELIGDCLQKQSILFNVMSKFIIENKDETIKSHLEKSLNRLGLNLLDTYFFHRFRDYEEFSDLIHVSQELKSLNLIRKVGVSLYSNEELDIAVNDPAVDIIQLPFNVFDSDPIKINLLKKAKNQNKEIHIRSIFLQGLFYKNPSSLTGNLKNFKDALEAFHDIRLSEKLSIEEACFGFANSFNCLDGIVIGVDNVEQLEKNIKWSKSKLTNSCTNKLQRISGFNKELLNPSNWKK